MPKICYYQRDANQNLTLATIKKFIIKRWRGCEGKGTLGHSQWECKLVQPLWKTEWRFLKETKNRATIESSNPSPGYTPKKNKNSNSKRYMHSNVHHSTIYNSQDMEATQVPVNRRLA